ncbi:MAG: 16S rRNA (cytosine(1402)-N(4))-methyltransferase RsmH [Halieaceae bacterium]|jgi:16S rRNA (cytosine1402-N4)-methyltransferase|nr:16S rRNA (cytosine(1402)-N(4))-methyltransferase RsmH [Halieaceae bacterium]
MAPRHDTVLLHEAVDALVGNPAGVYVDGTFGRGGHSREILSRLDADGRLIAVDKDEEAEREALELAGADPRFSFVRGSFAELPAILARLGVDAIDGLLLDLGVSSPQLDVAERGFSFLRDGPLDMRMDRSRGESAAEWLGRAEVSEIETVLRDYGEERYARRIAAALGRARDAAPITRTAQLAAVVSEAHPRWEKHHHPATRAFQAIRIRVNRELDDLDELLEAALPLLRAGARLVVISFHSLEDRRVKQYLRRMSRPTPAPRGIPLRDSDLPPPPLRLVGKAQRATAGEITLNPRARSAIMRCAERVA